MNEQRRQPPADLEAEGHVIGAVLVRPDLIGPLASMLDAQDFYRPQNATTFACMVSLWESGHKIDVKLVAASCVDGVPVADLVAMMGSVPQTTHADEYAALVRAAAARRQLLRLAGDVVEGAYRGADPGETIEQARTALDGVDLPAGQTPSDLVRLSTLMNRPEQDRTPWVVPGLLRRDWRIVFVAPEGAGKTLVMQQIGMCAAQGIDPFSFFPIPPVRVLFVDLENPEDRIVEGARMIDPLVRRISKVYDEEKQEPWIWNRPGGINLRSRADRAKLEAVLDACRPELVCMGPTYKMAEKPPGEGWDDQALATMRVIDDLRVRYGFALVMEDHAPQSSQGRRDLRPMGSSMWLRWPEIGIKLMPDDEKNPTTLKLGRWRQDRLGNEWPDKLDRGRQHSWPYEGRWDQGRYPQLEAM